MRALAVALHDVEPATFERCALIRDWLADHGVDRVTLLVVPARDLHPFFQRRPDLADWLLDCRDRGDAVAQHGLADGCQGRRGSEYESLDPDETRESVAAGRRMLELAGLSPSGFVAPGYVYPPNLRRELAGGRGWWATQLRVRRGGGSALAPAISTAAVRAGARLPGRVLRLDLHPADFDRHRRVRALERALARTGRRHALTFDDLCATT